MGAWERSTRAASLDDLSPPLATAINAYLDKYELRPVIGAIDTGIETLSTREAGRFRKRTETVMTGALLTASHLVIASGPPDQIGVFVLSLDDIKAEDHETSPMNKLMPDTGVHVTGIAGWEHGEGSIFLPVEPGATGDAFRAALRDGMAAAS